MPTHGYSNLRKGRASIDGQIYHIITRTYKRQPIFINFDAAVLACSTFTNAKALNASTLLAWVLMPDHAHWLLQLGEGEELSKLLQRMKSLSAKALRDADVHSGKVWHKGFYDRAIRKEEDIAAVARYIVANPLRAKLCQSLKQYPFWNAVYF